MHRGIARRTVFETDRDIRTFLAHVARAVREGTLEVHAFCVLTTHFHLLVRSPRGALGVAIGHVLNEYVRWFNRGRRRDGSLFRGRYGSRPVMSESYRRVLVRYIDYNPVEAGLVDDPLAYPHGSASRFIAPRAAPWLARSWIAGVVADRTDGAALDARSYALAFGRAPDEHVRAFVERRSARPPAEHDPLDELLAAAPPRVLAWMRRKAELADETGVGLPVCHFAGVRTAIDEARSSRGAWTLAATKHGGKTRDAWELLEQGLLADLCAATCEERAHHQGRSTNWASMTHRIHRHELHNDGGYSVMVHSACGFRFPLRRGSVATEPPAP